jgi:hypothetical protein
MQTPTPQQESIFWVIAEVGGEFLEWFAIPLIALAILMDFSRRAKAEDVS